MNDWRSVRQSLIPVLRRNATEADLDTFIQSGAGEDLLVWVARRTEAHAGGAYFFEYVTAETLFDWGVGQLDAFEAAYDNFSALDRGGQRISDESGDLVILDRFGASSASAVGSPKCMEWFRDLGEELVVGVPSRDRLFVTSRESRMASKVPDAVRHFFSKDEHPVSDQVYLWTMNSLTIWRPGAKQ